jgi:hypothetical protein
MVEIGQGLDMFVEKKRLGVAPVPMTASGTTFGLVTVPSIRGFFVKQIINIKSSTQPSLQVQINRFISDTQFYVGPVKGKIESRQDLSAYLLANTPTVEAAEQERPSITTVEHERAVYAEEPIVAKRSILVDDQGEYYNSSNPMPVSFSGGVSVSVKLTHLDNYPNVGDIADSTRIGDGTNILKMNTDGSINNFEQNKLITTKFDEITITRDIFDKISIVDFKVASVTQQSLALTRNINGSIVNVKRT